MPAINSLTSTICSSGSFNKTPVNGVDGVVPVGISYSWGPPTMSAGIAGGVAGSGASITGTLTNSNNTAGTAEYIVTPVSPAGPCTGATFTVTVTVNPKPAINDQTAAICSGGSFTITPADPADGIVPAGTLYTWAAPTITGSITGGAAGTSAANISGTLVNTSNIPQTATYTVTPATATCTGATFTVTVTVNPKPAINDITATICSGGTFTVTPANGTNGIVPAGTTYSWGVPVIAGTINPVLAGSGANISGTLTNTGSSAGTVTYTVTPESPLGPCTGATFTVTVTVNPMPAVNDFTPAVCSGTSFTVNPVDGTDGIVPAGTTYTWSAPSVLPGLVTGGAAGTNAATISGTLTNTTSSVQTATYTVTPKSGSCTGATFTVIVTVNPKPAVTNMSATTCSDAAFTVTPVDVTNGLVPAVTSYTWLAPAVSGGLIGGIAGSGTDITGTLTNPTNTAQTAIYTVTPTSSVALGSCVGSSFTVTVTVNPKPAINAMTSTVCSGSPFSVSPVNFTNGIVPAATTYTWTLPSITGALTGEAAGSGATITGTLTNTDNAGGTAVYTVTPVTGTCTGADFTVTVTVNPKPAINNLTTTICSAGSFTITPANGADGIVPAGTTYSWLAPSVTGGISGGSAGSGSANISGSLINPTSTQHSATYIVTPTANGCTGATFTITVLVDPKPSVSAMSTSICSGGSFSVTPVDVTNGIVPGGTTYSWPAPSVTGGMTGGDLGSGAAITGTLVNPNNSAQIATYTVTPVSGGCTGSTFTVSVTVNPMPAISDMTTAMCSGSTFVAAPVNGINGVVPAGTSYTWGAPVISGTLSAGAGGAGPNITGSLTNTGSVAGTATYTVTPVSGSCTGATFTVTVTVNPMPAVNDLTATICSEGTFTTIPVDGTDGIIPADISYSWSAPTMGAGITGGTSGSNSANISGTLFNSLNTAGQAIYTVTPKSGSCTGTPFTVTVTVNPKPAVTNMTATICSGGTFTALPVNTTNGIVPAGTLYTWSAPAVTSGLAAGAPGTSETEVSGTLINSSNTSQTAIYTVTPVAGAMHRTKLHCHGHCESDTGGQ